MKFSNNKISRPMSILRLTLDAESAVLNFWFSVAQSSFPTELHNSSRTKLHQILVHSFITENNVMKLFSALVKEWHWWETKKTMSFFTMIALVSPKTNSKHNFTTLLFKKSLSKTSEVIGNFLVNKKVKEKIGGRRGI